VTIVARLVTDADSAARLQDMLAEMYDGEAVAITIAQESERPWSLELHFRDRPDEVALRTQIASLAGQAAAAEVVFEELAPTDWVRKSLEGLQPVRAGRFMVHGAHHRGRVAANRIGVQIEAALAFGTGHHGSTQGCLLALDRIAKRDGRTRVERVRSCASAHPASSARRRTAHAAVLDIGTGSGVLAIAAAKALHRPVLAGDIDRRAVAIARDNSRINGVASRIEIVHAAGVGARRFRERSPFALVLANILLDPLQKLAAPIRQLVAPSGHVVLSGLLNAQAAAAIASYRTRGLVLSQRIALGGWTTVVLVRPSRAKGANCPPRL
jgi:ribosomal protein L11 methyltransferase